MRKAIEAIRKYKKFLVTAHVNPEGDSIGSQLAMKELLLGMGKQAIIVDNDPVPGHYKFLPKADEVSNRIDKSIQFDAAVILDCPTMKRIGDVRYIIPKDRPIINIDHHISNEEFGRYNWVDPHASSTGEMVYRLFKETGTKMTKDIALCIYIAILTDTGSFNYDNTSKAAHEIAGELLGYGLDPAGVSEDVYEKRSLADMKLLGMVLDTIKVNSAGNVAYMEMTRKMLEETGAQVAKSEGLVNYARSIDGAMVAVLFREDSKDRNKINVSFRSKGDVDVNRIASFFGGGGHVKASGCVIEGTLASAEKKVLGKIEEMLGGRDTGSK